MGKRGRRGEVRKEGQIWDEDKRVWMQLLLQSDCFLTGFPPTRPPTHSPSAPPAPVFRAWS